MLNRFVSSSTLRPCKDAGVRPLLTLNSLLYSSFSGRADPLRSFADQLRLTQAQSIRLVEYIEPVQERWGRSIIDFRFAVLPARPLPAPPLPAPPLPPPPHPAPPGLTHFELLQISSD